MKVTIDYTDGVYGMYPALKGAIHTQEISTETWCKWQLFVVQERQWHNFFRKLDEIAFRADDPRED